MSNSSNQPANNTASVLPIRMVGNVVPGFGRGSKDLGIPTANLDTESLQSSVPFQDLETGIYWGYGTIQNQTYKTAISIGYNPTYGNKKKTIEPHFIAPSSDPRRHRSKTNETLLEDFYNSTCRIVILGYLRPELPFEGLDKLIEAIKQDICSTEKLAESKRTEFQSEIAWVASSEPI